MSSKKSYLEPVNEIPKANLASKAKQSQYDAILKEFIDKDLKCARIKPIEGKKTKSMLGSLNQRITKNRYPVRIRIRGEELYLEKK